MPVSWNVVCCRFGVMLVSWNVVCCRFGVMLVSWNVVCCCFGVMLVSWNVVCCRFGVMLVSWNVVCGRFRSWNQRMRFEGLLYIRIKPAQVPWGNALPQWKAPQPILKECGAVAGDFSGFRLSILRDLRPITGVYNRGQSLMGSWRGFAFDAILNKAWYRIRSTRREITRKFILIKP